MLTSQPELAQGQNAPHQDWAPPPGVRTDWSSMGTYQPPPMPNWDQPEDPKVSSNYGYGEAPPPPPEPPKPKGRNQVVNPKPTAPLNMEAMMLAAQAHMQKALANKLLNIGVPIPGHLRTQAGLTNDVTTSYVVPEAIPLPGDPMGDDMDIADIVVPGEGPDIPLPPGPGGALDDIAAPEEDDIAAPEEVPSESIAVPSEEAPGPPGEEEDCRPPGED